MWRHFETTFRIKADRYGRELYHFSNRIFRLIDLMMRTFLILTIVYLALVNVSAKDDLKDKAAEALRQGEKVKVCSTTRKRKRVISFFSLFDSIRKRWLM